MKLNIEEYYENNNVKVTEKGWIDLRKFCSAVIRKRIGNPPYAEDLISTAMLECIDALDKYDAEKNNQLGGYLFFICLGVISKAANKAKKELIWDYTRGEVPDDERYKRV